MSAPATSSKVRPVAAIARRDLSPAAISPALPQFDWIDPRSLCIEDDYQRGLSPNSIKMVRRIVENWSWAKIKPVIAVRVGNRLMIIDGQHTAIAAVTHGGIDKVPVMIVAAETVKERAEAFISQNRDRLALTPMHMHYAAVAAGEEIAVAVAQACAKAGVTILRNSRGTGGLYRVGDTFAIGTIKRIVAKIGVHHGARILKILVEAKRAPIVAHEIAAVHALLFDPQYKGKVDTFDLVTIIRSKPMEAWRAEAWKLVSAGIARRKAPAAVFFKALGGGGLVADFEARCQLLERENEALRDRVALLETQLGIVFDAPAFFGLSAKEAQLFGIFLARDAVTKSLVMDAMYGNRPDGDAADEKIVDVFVCKLRAKLKPFGLEIETNRGQGYFMTPAMKAKARALTDERAAT